MNKLNWRFEFWVICDKAAHTFQRSGQWSSAYLFEYSIHSNDSCLNRLRLQYWEIIVWHCWSSQLGFHMRNQRTRNMIIEFDTELIDLELCFDYAFFWLSHKNHGFPIVSASTYSSSSSTIVVGNNYIRYGLLFFVHFFSGCSRSNCWTEWCMHVQCELMTLDNSH